MRNRVGAAACALGLALVGCGAGAEDDPPAQSPLAAYLGVDTLRSQVGFPTLTEDERQRQYAMEELIAGCMAQAGFEYVPVTSEQRMAGAFAEAYALAPAEFAERYGYGITTLTVEQSATGYVDPNQEIRAGLAPDQQQAYDRALWEECHTRASTEVYGSPSDLDQGYARFDALLDGIGELYQRIEDDPRLAEANQRWAVCLAEAGYPDLASPTEARQSVFDRLSALPAEAAAPGSDAAAEVRDYELAVAPVDHACQREHLAGPRREVSFELEQEFVDAHRPELEAYRDWLAEHRGT